MNAQTECQAQTFNLKFHCLALRLRFAVRTCQEPVPLAGHWSMVTRREFWCPLSKRGRSDSGHRTESFYVSQMIRRTLLLWPNGNNAKRVFNACFKDSAKSSSYVVFVGMSAKNIPRELSLHAYMRCRNILCTNEVYRKDVQIMSKRYRELFCRKH